MFSNVAYLDAEITRYLDTGCLHILFKLDSLRPDRISRLYGIHTPELHLGKVMEVLDAVLVSEGQTNLAASIVMTKENLDELDVLLDFCDDSRVFPLVADLEESGRGKRVAEELRLDESELRLVRETLEARYGPGYGIPICPSVIAGMHVTPDDHVIVDEATGLSCHWFWLTEPKVHTVGVLACGYGYQEAARDVIRYRTEQLPEVERLVASGTSLTLGGCGGDIQAMLRRYLEAHSVATCQPR